MTQLFSLRGISSLFFQNVLCKIMEITFKNFFYSGMNFNISLRPLCLSIYSFYFFPALSLSLSLVLFISMYLSGVFSLSPPFWTECVTNLFPIYLCHVSSNLLFWIIYAWNFVLLKASSLYYVFTIGLCAFLVLSTTTCAAKPMVTFCTNRSKCKARDVLHH